MRRSSERTIKYRLVELAIATLLTICLNGTAHGQQESSTTEALRVDAALAKRGKKIFQSRMCSSCHLIGKGKAVGPDLKGVTERRTREWLKTMIMTPEIALAQDTIAQRLRSEHGNISMPNMRVNPEEFEQLLHFLASREKN